MLRESLAALIGSTTDMEIIDTYPDAESAIATIPGHPPDVVVMDLNLAPPSSGRKSGVDCVAAIKAALPSINVLVLTVYDDAGRVFEALRAGEEFPCWRVGLAWERQWGVVFQVNAWMLLEVYFLRSSMVTDNELPPARGDDRFDDEEWADWYTLTPLERLEESSKLWQTYLKLGGSLDPEPDTQSPFFDLVYLDDGLMPIDNNETEQLMKQVALGRKNWMFIGSVAAGSLAADLMSLVSSAHRNDLDIFVADGRDATEPEHPRAGGSDEGKGGIEWQFGETTEFEHSVLLREHGGRLRRERRQAVEHDRAAATTDQFGHPRRQNTEMAELQKRRQVAAGGAADRTDVRSVQLKPVGMLP